MSGISVDAQVSARRGELRTRAEAGTGDTVSNRAQPGELGLVDGEVGARGALETLVV